MDTKKLAEISQNLDNEVKVTQPFVQEVIDILKSNEADGETLQEILEQLGMASQVLKQLLVTHTEDLRTFDFPEDVYIKISQALNNESLKAREPGFGRI